MADRKELSEVYETMRTAYLDDALRDTPLVPYAYLEVLHSAAIRSGAQDLQDLPPVSNRLQHKTRSAQSLAWQIVHILALNFASIHALLKDRVHTVTAANKRQFRDVQRLVASYCTAFSQYSRIVSRALPTDTDATDALELAQLWGELDINANDALELAQLWGDFEDGQEGDAVRNAVTRGVLRCVEHRRRQITAAAAVSLSESSGDTESDYDSDDDGPPLLIPL